jgi:hypothetical protein
VREFGDEHGLTKASRIDQEPGAALIDHQNRLISEDDPTRQTAGTHERH